MKKALLALIFASAAFFSVTAQASRAPLQAEEPDGIAPAQTQENPWGNPPAMQVPREKLDFMIHGALRMPCLEDGEKPWHFSIVTDKEKISGIAADAEENTSAIIIAVKEESANGNNPDFTAGMAAAEIMKAGARMGVSVSLLTAPAEDMNAAQKTEFGIPEGYKGAAVALVKENPGSRRRPGAFPPDREFSGRGPAPFPPAHRAHHVHPAAEHRRYADMCRQDHRPVPAPVKAPAPECGRWPAPGYGRGPGPEMEREPSPHERVREEISEYITVIE